MLKHLIIPAIMALPLLTSHATAEESSPAIQITRMTLESATRIASATIDACRKEGIQISVTVVDRNGEIQAVQRDTLAPPISLKISHQKAYTAANFMSATSKLQDRGNTPIGRVSPLLMSAGGVPVEANGQLLGAVGVSGAPSGVTDENCAQAGIDAIIDDLQMM